MLLSGAMDLSNLFSNCAFDWIKRGINVVAHALAKSFNFIKSYVYCNSSSLLNSVMNAWRKDFLSYLVS